MHVSQHPPALDPWYITGFVEGEGCFTYSRSGRQMALYFAIKLTGADAALLDAIRIFFGGAGRIYRVKPRAPIPRSGFTKAAAYYRVCKTVELDRIVSHFDIYPLRGLKTRSYAIWKEMVAVKKLPPRQRGDTLDSLAHKLSEASPRNAEWFGDPGPLLPGR